MEVQLNINDKNGFFYIAENGKTVINKTPEFQDIL